MDTENQKPEPEQPYQSLDVSAQPVENPPSPTNDPKQTGPEQAIQQSYSGGETPHKSKWRFLRPEIIFWPKLRNKLGTKARPVAIIIIVLLLALVGGLSYRHFSANKQTALVVGSFKAQHVQFKLVSTIPSKNATNVNTASNVTLNFNQPIDANKLVNNVFITPTLNGTFKQGKNSSQVIFVPTQPLTQGIKYSVMINGTTQNNQGAQLGVPVEYGFTTSIPISAIAFQDQNGLLDYVTSLASGQKETYTLNFGSDVGQTATVKLYQGSVNDLLGSLVYANTTTAGYTSPQFSDSAVSTTGLTQVSSIPNLKDQSTFDVQQPDGLYLAVATNSSGKEVGFVWINFSSFGVLLRQDDQKTVLDAQAFNDSQDVDAQATFYNLNGSVNTLGQQAVNGLTTADFGFNQNLDMVVANYGSETAIVPVNILESGGDIRVDQDLSTAQAVYGITDKPTYKAGDTINYSGYVRLDNDAQYVNPGSGSVKFYVGTYKGSTPLASFTAAVDANGMFSGSIAADSSWLTSGDDFDQFQLFASSVSGNSNNDISVASFTEAAKTNQANNISVAFSKASYLPSDQITATIKGIGSNGQPLANKAVQVHVFSQDYYDNNPAANKANFGYFGNELTNSPTTVQLNANGQATYTLKASSLPSDGNSQMVTIQANLPNQSGVGAAGGDSTIVHQGNGYITFGPNRQQIPSGANLVSDVYANQLSGAPLANNAIHYSLVDTSNSQQLASGSATTDSNGFVAITVSAGQLASNGDSMALKVTTNDQYGNTILSQNFYSVANKLAETYDTSGAGLFDLNVTGTSGNVKVGDTVNIKINSPAAVRALVTKDRGRIYQPAMLSLNQGNNNYSFVVTQDLAPSFTLTFSYFLNGIYHSEGVAFNVAEPNNQSQVSIQLPTSTTANQPANIQINSKDNSNNNLPTSLIVDVVSAKSYSLTSQVNPDIFASLYSPRPIMTSSSSSLSPIGSGGGGCGGGGAPLPSFTNAVGSTLYWNPEIQTDSSGQANVTFNPPKGSWTITVYAMSDDTQVGSQTATFTAN